VWKYGDAQWKPSVTEERECGDKAGGLTEAPTSRSSRGL
jgi:hypothetical protein